MPAANNARPGVLPAEQRQRAIGRLRGARGPRARPTRATDQPSAARSCRVPVAGPSTRTASLVPAPRRPVGNSAHDLGVVEDGGGASESLPVESGRTGTPLRAGHGPHGCGVAWSRPTVRAETGWTMRARRWLLVCWDGVAFANVAGRQVAAADTLLRLLHRTATVPAAAGEAVNDQPPETVLARTSPYKPHGSEGSGHE
jgi:hypothetical protein